MFTGIVEEVGTVKAVSPTGLTVAAVKVLEGTEIGDSIAVNGVCLTATVISADWFAVEVMPETLRRTNLGSLKAGDIVKEIAPIVGGGGGGRPQMAQAGGKNPAKIKEALQKAKEIITEKLG